MAIVASDSSDSNPWATTLERLVVSRPAAVLMLAGLVCLVTRLGTGLQNKRQSASKSEPKEIPLLPYWLPWLGHGIQFGTRFQNFLADASKTTKDSVFRLTIAGTVHNIVVAPSVTRQIMLKGSSVTANEFTYWVMEKVFGTRGLRSIDPSLVFGKIHHVLFQLNRDPFVSDATAITVDLVEERIANLVSFSPSWVDQSLWERAANVQVDPSETSAEVSLFPLLRYFVGDLASTVLMGQDFMANNPTIIPDLFTFDASFSRFIAGFPRWFPGMAPAYQARGRIAQAVHEHQEALYAVWDGHDPGSRWGDLSDVSKVMQDRAREWRNVCADPDVSSRSDMAVLWAMNVNANQTVFWLIWHVYQLPQLRAEILREISSYVKLTTVKSDLPIPEPARLSINLDGLLHDCPLFKATFYETLRLEVPSVSYKAVTKTFTVTESAEDAALHKSQPQTYSFPQGTYICIPHGAHSTDQRHWKDSHTFNPRRFFVVDGKDSTRTTVDMGTMTPFGGGATMCKGRKFAEREVLLFAAAVLVTWDVEPVGRGGWRDPGRLLGSGAFTPKMDVRVKIRRRVPG